MKQSVREAYDMVPAKHQRIIRREIDKARVAAGYESTRSTIYNWINQAHELNEWEQGVIAKAFEMAGYDSPFITPQKNEKEINPPPNGDCPHSCMGTKRKKRRLFTWYKRKNCN